MAEFEQMLQPYLEAEQELYESGEGYSRGADYAEIREQCTINEKLMLFTSFFGRGMICNPYALFQYCMNSESFREYSFVWTLDDIEKHELEIERYRNDKRVIFVELHTKEYYRYLSSAKYLINNVTEPSYFVKKEGQIVINTWHGIPLKYLGYDIPNGAYESPNSIRNFLMSDFILSPNGYMTQKYSEAFKLHDLYDGKIIEAGYPRCDTLINIDKEAFIKKASAYGVKIDSEKKIILYAPTWRGEKYASPDISMTEYNIFLDHIKNAINPDEYQILFKPHQIVYKNLQEQGLADETMVPATIDANELLGVTDILVSDYSSIFFDFLATGRPILFYVSDLEEYKTTRGLYFPVDELPGPVSDDAGIVAGWMKKLTCNEVKYSELFDYSKYESAVSRFVPNEDGHVCERAIKAIFDNDNTHVVSFKTKKPRLLFHMDLLEHSSITSAFLLLLNCIDYDKYDVTLNAILPKNGENILLSVNENVRILCSLGRTYGTIKDTAIRNYCTDNSIVGNDEKDFFPTHVYETEFRRRFGYCKYDCIINFSGIDSHWVNVFWAQRNTKQITWIHNMVDAEFVLEKMDRGQIITIDNGEWYVNINEEKTEKTELDVILVPCPVSDNINFVSVGRLEPENNYDVLLKAFKRLADENEHVVLYILGDGSLKTSLQTLIKELKLEGRVILTGYVLNPFVIECMCQCFVMTSFCDKIPMPLLEARALGMPFIMPEIDPVKNALFEGGQFVIQINEESVYERIKAFVDNRESNKPVFDWKAYNMKCMDEFNRTIEETLQI
ncbi:MAG: CDP-glycerol glycerophosphotransferase family protein [Lachnospiraceae bacterium]|nr:CDP-glycerol glycerophosphotransferase family protein [Lachnospiraceae bacterium]